MSAKQDRQGARTPEDLESRYKFGESFAKAYGLAQDAQDAADEVKKLVVEGMTPDAIFDTLTNNGQNQGLFKGEDGELYINASYIVSGILKSLNGATRFDLDDGKITCTDNFGTVVKIDLGNISLLNGEKELVKIHNLGFGGGLTFKSADNGEIVGSFTGLSDGLHVNYKKPILFSGSASIGESFTVPQSTDFDLFSVRLGDDTPFSTTVLAYRVGNFIRGVGGYSGSASADKTLLFLSVECDGNTWTLVDCSMHRIDSSGNIGEATKHNIKEITGVL